MRSPSVYTSITEDQYQAFLVWQELQEREAASWALVSDDEGDDDGAKEEKEDTPGAQFNSLLGAVPHFKPRTDAEAHRESLVIPKEI